MWFANILSWPELLFSSIRVFIGQILENLMRSNLLVFLFVVHAFNVKSKVVLSSPWSWWFYPVLFFSTNFIVLNICFLQRFCWIFCVSFEFSFRSSFPSFCLWTCSSVPSTIFLKALLLCLCQKSVGCIYMGLYLGSLFCPLLCVFPSANTTLSQLLNLYSSP